VEGDALVSDDAFSVRYDVDGTTGTITRPSHDLYSANIAGKVLIFRTSKGGVATAWALLELKRRGIAPLALICDTTNPVFVQGSVLAEIPIMDGFKASPRETVRTGDCVRVDPRTRVLSVIRRFAHAKAHPSSSRLATAAKRAGSKRP
jgi:uncharacterized protein